MECAVALFIGLAVPVGAGACLAVLKPEQIGWIIVGTALATLFLLQAMAGLPIGAHPGGPSGDVGGALSFLDRLTTAYSTVCGAGWTVLALLAGLAAGLGIGSEVKKRQRPA